MSKAQQTSVDGLQSGPKTAIIIGAGNRGHIYASYAMSYPEKLKIVGVCDPREFQRNSEQKLHNIPPENVFAEWTEAASRDKFADCALICTPARLHKDPAIAFARKGYHILLEKPMAVTEEDCKEIVNICQENDILLCVCHVLRYTPWVQKVKAIIASGRLGDIVSITHTMQIGLRSFTHYNVRGYNRREDHSSFTLMGTGCHDIDLLCYWMSGKQCLRVSSFGNLSHFRKEDQPKGAPSRCMDCPAEIENNCPYSAKRLYLEPVRTGSDLTWHISMVADIVDVENIERALREGPYGKCVYSVDNDLMSHQVVNMQFEGGATATFQIVAFSKKMTTRETKLYGTKGELIVKEGSQPNLKLYDFLTKKTENISIKQSANAIPEPLRGYGGADFYTIEAFVDALYSTSGGKIQTGPEETLRSHLLVFAAERARKENRVVNLKQDRQYD